MHRSRCFLSIIIAASMSSGAVAELRLEKDFRFPFFRVDLVNPTSVGNYCRAREFSVTHRRDAKGRPYDVKVEPMGDAESELVPLIYASFAKWLFPVPTVEEWKEEFLSITHTTIFTTKTPSECHGTP
jgi:hypothetical protein